eukprot:CAMPEP_0174725650 /NCGR_PEP_ID=MMETSP1094-20130205/46118_1 /TAXON_ID=156173 /ORGANISM="Chrysochromulina brevifilum, Strain UTEX LB 985" /LENGTH=57 /DNA_ID=CAMNT_0015927097 /DNA_START=328 /DNA_END=498 /DNA_ORIENTATION=-
MQRRQACRTAQTWRQTAGVCMGAPRPDVVQMCACAWPRSLGAHLRDTDASSSTAHPP